MNVSPSCLSMQWLGAFRQRGSGKLSAENLKVDFTESAFSSNLSVRISCLAPTPQISVLSDEYSRPAVIGHAGSLASYPDSAEAIKDILVSVLSASGLKPSLLSEHTTMQGAENPDSDLERWEESSNGENDDDTDSDSVHQSTACTQTDVRFTRHRACWDNTNCDSSRPALDTFFHPCYSDKDPATSSLNGFALSDVSPLKRDCFTQVTLTGGTVTSAVVHPEKECQNLFPEQDLALTRLPPDSTGSKPTDLFKHPAASEPAKVSNADSSSPCVFSQLEPFNRTGSASLLNVSAVPLNRTLQDIFVLPEDVEKENAHFFVADMIIASLEKMKCNILSQQAESWGVDETSGSDGSYHTDSELSSYPGEKKSDSSVASTDSGYEGCGMLMGSSSVHLPLHHEATGLPCPSDSEDEYVIIELEHLENLSVTSNERPSFEPGSNSAEATAQELCRAFRKQWLQTESAVQLSGCLSSSKQRVSLSREQRALYSVPQVTISLQFSPCYG